MLTDLETSLRAGRMEEGQVRAIIDHLEYVPSAS